jgi:hypothetical protein
MKKGIRKFEWDWTNNGSYDHTESPGDGKASHTYSTAGTYTCKLRVTDDDDDCCCDGSGCDDKTDTTTLTVRVVEVNEVVANVSPYDNNGPLYACIDGSVGLKAKAYPSGSFPSGEPDWTIESKPAGASVSLFPASGSATTSLAGLTKSGTYVVKAKCGSSDTGDTITIKVIEITSTSVTVDANATQTNVTGAENWAALKEAGEYVIVKATVTPSISVSNLPSCFYWTGGQEVPGEPLKRRVSKAVSAKTRVTATAGTSSDYVDIWILWASGTIRTSGSKSANNNKSFASGKGGDTLGALTDEDHSITAAEAVGKMEGVFTLSPSGVYAVATGGWDIKRWVDYEWYENGSLDGSDSKSDDTVDSDEDLDPDSDDKIYVIDGPTCGKDFGVNHTKEVYNGFREWVEWNGEKCSSDYYWHYRARVDDDLDAANKPDNDDTELNDVGTGSISLPGSAHYSPR